MTGAQNAYGLARDLGTQKALGGASAARCLLAGGYLAQKVYGKSAHELGHRGVGVARAIAQEDAAGAAGVQGHLIYSSEGDVDKLELGEGLDDLRRQGRVVDDDNVGALGSLDQLARIFGGGVVGLEAMACGFERGGERIYGFLGHQEGLEQDDVHKNAPFSCAS